MEPLVIQLLGLALILISLVNIHHILSKSGQTKVWVPRKAEAVVSEVLESEPVRVVHRPVEVEVIDANRTPSVPQLTGPSGFDDLYKSRR